MTGIGVPIRPIRNGKNDVIHLNSWPSPALLASWIFFSTLPRFVCSFLDRRDVVFVCGFQGRLVERHDAFFGAFRRCNFPRVDETGLVAVVEECGRYNRSVFFFFSVLVLKKENFFGNNNNEANPENETWQPSSPTSTTTVSSRGIRLRFIASDIDHFGDRFVAKK